MPESSNLASAISLKNRFTISSDSIFDKPLVSLSAWKSSILFILTASFVFVWKM